MEIFGFIKNSYLLCAVFHNTKERNTTPKRGKMTNELKHIIRCIGLAVLTSLLFLPTASAQRTQSGQSSLRASLLYNGLSVGAEAFYEQYTLGGYWTVGGSGNHYMAGLSSGNTLDYLHALAQGGYMFRLAGTRSRNLSFYTGGGVLAGVEVLDPLASLPGHIILPNAKYAFLYGLYGQAAVELFVSGRLAIALTASAPASFGSGVAVVNWNVGVGMKLNL